MPFEASTKPAEPATLTGDVPNAVVPLPKRQLDASAATADATVASLNTTLPSPLAAVLSEKMQLTNVVLPTAT